MNPDANGEEICKWQLRACGPRCRVWAMAEPSTLANCKGIQVRRSSRPVGPEGFSEDARARLHGSASAPRAENAAFLPVGAVVTFQSEVQR